MVRKDTNICCNILGARRIQMTEINKTPKEIVSELDQYIIGQDEAKTPVGPIIKIFLGVTSCCIVSSNCIRR
jgi:ATP-dependent protease Clp ATPase subunit